MAEAAGAPESEFDRLWTEICDLGLETYVADLDANGYTVIPPEIASPNGLAERMLEGCLDVAERRNGVRPDLLTSYSDSGDSPVGDAMSRILLEDRVFEESLMNPPLLALVTHLMGYNVVMSSMSCFFKGPNKTAVPVAHGHTVTGTAANPGLGLQMHIFAD